MTEKQFESDGWKITFNDREIGMIEASNLLNEVYNKNKGLKKHLEFVRNHRDKLILKNAELEKENNQLKLYVNVLGLGIHKILHTLKEDKEDKAMIMCVELLKKLEEEKLLGDLND